MKARRGPRKQLYVFHFAARNPELFNVGSASACHQRAPRVGSQIQFLRPYQIAYSATLMRSRDALPPGILITLDEHGFIDQHAGGRQVVEDGLHRSRHRRIELPSGKHRDSSVLDRGMNRLLGPGNALSRQARVNRRQ